MIRAFFLYELANMASPPNPAANVRPEYFASVFSTFTPNTASPVLASTIARLTYSTTAKLPPYSGMVAFTGCLSGALTDIGTDNDTGPRLQTDRGPVTLRISKAKSKITSARDLLADLLHIRQNPTSNAALLRGKSGRGLRSIATTSSVSLVSSLDLGAELPIKARLKPPVAHLTSLPSLSPMLRSFARTFSSSSRRADVARLTAVGRIGADLQILQAKSGREYLRYPLAVQNSRKETSWFNVSVFDPNTINFMTAQVGKGATVYIEADVTYTQYVNDSGETRQSLNLVQQSISPVIWKKPEDSAAAESQPAA